MLAWRTEVRRLLARSLGALMVVLLPWVVWAVLIIYVFFLWRRIGRVERELGDVNRKLSQK